MSRALHIGKFYPPELGGIENFVFDLVEELSKTMVCDVLCSNTKNETVIETHDRYTVTRAASIGRIFSTSLAPALAKQFQATWKRYDIVHVHLPNPLAVWAIKKVNPSVKIVIHWHSDIVKQKNLLFAYKPLENWLLEKAEKIITTSDGYRDASQVLQPFKEKCVTIPLGLNPGRLIFSHDRVEKIKKDYGEKPIIFSVGRLVYYKGFEYLITAMKNLDAQLFIGGTGPFESKLKKQIADLKIESKVHLLGRISEEDIGSFYQVCDVFCLPSVERAEAFGLVQVEAMYFGRPIVSTNIPGSGTGWVNQDGKTGIVVPPKDSVKLAEALSRLIKDKKLREELGSGGQARFNEYFHISSVAKKISGLYDSLTIND